MLLLKVYIFCVSVSTVIYQYIEILSAKLCRIFTSDITYLKTRPFYSNHLVSSPQYHMKTYRNIVGMPPFERLKVSSTKKTHEDIPKINR